MNFSIEGQRIPGAKVGIDVTKSIARKVTITVTPCNKSAVAELYKKKLKQNSNDIDSIFKTEPTEIEIFKFTPNYLEVMQKMEQTQVLATDAGLHLGNNKPVYSHSHIHDYRGFSSQDHHEAAMLHHNAAEKATDPKVALHHTDKMKLHLSAAQTASQKEARLKTGLAQRRSQILGKAIDAGSALSASKRRVDG